MSRLFIPMTKVDAAQRLVYGRIDETPDRAGMVLDYQSSKPEFEKWSQTMQKASAGKSFGNVRAMHGLVAAGRLDQIEFDDDGKAIEICAKIVDDDEWRKVEECVYTGFSPGGRFIKKWNDGTNIRYTAGPVEMSLVDMPAIPSATFTMLKADGATETLTFRPPSEEAELRVLAADLAEIGGGAEYRALLMAQPTTMIKALFPTDELRAIAETNGLAKRYWSEEERLAAAELGEALPDGSFPIRAKADVEDAVQAHPRARDRDAAKALITKRAKDLEATDMLPEAWEGSTMKKVAQTAGLAKGMNTITCLAGILQSIRWLQQDQEWESKFEGDNSDLPAKLKAWLADGGDLLVQAVGEEVSEMKAGGEADLAMAARSDDMRGIVTIADMAKAAGEIARIKDDAMKLAAEVASGKERLAKVEGENAELQKRLAGIPRPGGAARRGVARGDDTGNRLAQSDQTELARIEALPEGLDKANAMMRWTMAHPQPVQAPARVI